MKKIGQIFGYILAGFAFVCAGFFLWNFCNGVFAELTGRVNRADPEADDYDPEFEKRYH